MLYPVSFENKLGFDIIRGKLLGYCVSSLGKSLVSAIRFMYREEEIFPELKLTWEMFQVISFEEGFPSQDYYDLIPEFRRTKILDTYIEPETLSELRLSLHAITALIRFFSVRKDRFPGLSALIYSSATHGQQTGISVKLQTAMDQDREQEETEPAFFLELPAEIIRKIDRILDDKSQIRDHASPELSKLRKEKAFLMAGVEHKILHDLKIARQSGWTPEDAEVTIRNGRLVIPMLSAHKRKINGYIHDESATGQTIYIEPAAIFETNNEIRELEYAEKREILKILIALTDEIRPYSDVLISLYRYLGQIDFLRAKAMLAAECQAILPKFIEPRSESIKKKSAFEFNWINAIHPILLSHFRQIRKTVVPLNLSFDPHERILVISGPNAGGKSVCLKTAGLVQYMFQCGLLPPVREDSEFVIFKKIFIDIGDEQSIDNDLSTYTSKLVNLKYFLENADEQTLLLIDEFGSGTDPSQGGAIAEICLESIASKGCYAIITTHYSNLKLLAGKVKGIVNGAMLYDTRKFKPLYILKKGKPGSSFAFDIAAGIGFPKELLKKARTVTGTSQLNFERQIQDLEIEKEEISKKNSELRVADDFLAEVTGKYEKLTTELEKSKKEILENARQEALRMISDANKAIERTIKEIREAQAEKEKTKSARSSLTDIREKLESINTGPKPSALPGIRQDEPDLVSGKKTRSSGDIKANKVLLGLPALSSIGETKPEPKQYQKYIDELHRKLREFQSTLDLRGKRVDEALFALQKYIDDAIMLSISEVRILHGKGNGILRQVTRDYLHSLTEVKSAKDEHIERGGAGITVVIFR